MEHVEQHVKRYGPYQTMKLFLLVCAVFVGYSCSAQVTSYISLEQIEKIKRSISSEDSTSYATKEDCGNEILKAIEELKSATPIYHWIGMPSSFEAQEYFFKKMYERFGVSTVDDGCITGSGMECHNIVIEAAIKIRFGENVLKELEEECEQIILLEEKKMEKHRSRFDISADQVVAPIDTLK